MQHHKTAVVILWGDLPLQSWPTTVNDWSRVNTCCYNSWESFFFFLMIYNPHFSSSPPQTQLEHVVPTYTNTCSSSNTSKTTNTFSFLRILLWNDPFIISWVVAVAVVVEVIVVVVDYWYHYDSNNVTLQHGVRRSVNQTEWTCTLSGHAQHAGAYRGGAFKLFSVLA